MSRSLFGNFLPLILSFLNICVKSSISRGDLDLNSTFTCNGRGWTPSMTPRYNSLPEKNKFRHDNTIRVKKHNIWIWNKQNHRLEIMTSVWFVHHNATMFFSVVLKLAAIVTVYWSAIELLSPAMIVSKYSDSIKVSNNLFLDIGFSMPMSHGLSRWM